MAALFRRDLAVARSYRAAFFLELFETLFAAAGFYFLSRFIESPQLERALPQRGLCLVDPCRTAPMYCAPPQRQPLRQSYRQQGTALKQLLPDEPGSPSQAQIATQLGMTENAIRQAFYRFRQRYQSLLREEIANTVATPADIEDELRHLIAALRS